MSNITVKVGPLPAGIKINPSGSGDYPKGKEYKGISYCDALRRATTGKGGALVIGPDSVSTCLWNPQVFGFKPPDDRFDLKVEYSLPGNTENILIAPLDYYESGYPPDVVVIRTVPSEVRKIYNALGESRFNVDMAGRLDRSAIEIFSGGGRGRDKRRVKIVSRILGDLNQFPEWRDFTKFIFKYEWTTYIFDLFLDRFLANMSLCRNATVIPHLTGKANISFFCTGAIAWGLNNPRHIACGIPYPLAEGIRFISESA